MSKFIYYTKQGKFEAENFDNIPWNELHSPNNDTPALQDYNGSIAWYKNGKCHRDNDLPASITKKPTYYKEGLSLRCYSSGQFYFYEGCLSRLNGPAVITENKEKYFLLNDNRYEFEDWLKNHPNQDISFQTKMRLQYS